MAKPSKVTIGKDPYLNRIPAELMQFVQRDTYSLLIKGYSGTGKTTLSLTILKALQVRSNFFYISTRISPKQLFAYYPWLDKFVEQQEIQRSNELSDQSYNLSSFEDARLDEPESLFERITNQLMDVKAPIIIIDSWDAIASFMDKEARLNNERVLQTWRERAGAKLVFTSEDPKDTTLDFLVDGIVELKQMIYSNIRIREIFLSKLRGIKINKPSYIYTLNNGIFTSYFPYNPSNFTIKTTSAIDSLKYAGQQHDRVRPISNSGHVKLGCAYLDNIFARRFSKNEIMLLETDEFIGPAVMASLIAKLIAIFVTSNNPVLIPSLEGVDPRILLAYLQPYMQQKSLKGLLKIFYPDHENRRTSDVLIPFNVNTSLEERIKLFENTVLETRNRYPEKRLLYIFDSSRQQSSNNVRKNSILDLMSIIKLNPDLLILLSATQQKQEYSTYVLDVHLRLKIISDTLFIQSIIPHCHLHTLLAKRSLGIPKIKLECIV